MFFLLNNCAKKSLLYAAPFKLLYMTAKIADLIEFNLLRMALWGLIPFCASEVRPALWMRSSKRAKNQLAPVWKLRGDLREDVSGIPMPDFGSGRRKTTLDTGTFAKPPTRIVSEIFQKASTRHAWGMLLYHLIKEKQPKTVLELGTNLGVSGAYIVQAMQENRDRHKRLITLEGNPSLSERAEKHLAALCGEVDVKVITGMFMDTLPTVLSKWGPFDMVFLDGHHERNATLRYFDLISPHLESGAWVVFDDLEPWSPTVRGAFRDIRSRYPKAKTADLVKLGVLIWP